jgi:hypothetical protein
MDEWRIQQQQQQQRMVSGGVGPVLSYHPIRSRSSPYPSPQQMSELKQSYQYQQNSSNTSSNPLSPSTTSATTPNPNQTAGPLSVKNDSNDTSSSSTDEISTTTANTVCLKSIIIFDNNLFHFRMFIHRIIPMFLIHLFQ